MSAEAGSAITGRDRSPYRGGLTVRIHRLDDARVSGTVTASWNVNRLGMQDHGTVDVQKGAIRVANARGAWVDTCIGHPCRAGRRHHRGLVSGSGGYSGLGYFEFLRWDGTVQGQVFPAASLDELPF